MGFQLDMNAVLWLLRLPQIAADAAGGPPQGYTAIRLPVEVVALVGAVPLDEARSVRAQSFEYTLCR